MSNLRIADGQVITDQSNKVMDLYLSNGLVSFAPMKASESFSDCLDAKDCYVTPGLFDLQVNGDQECDLWANFTANDFANLCFSMLQSGVTAFLPTLITDDIEHLYKNIALLESMGVGSIVSSQINRLIAKKIAGLENIEKVAKLISLPGIHLEGPYLSCERVGAHPPQFIRPIVLTELSKLIRPSVKLMTIAPELENGAEAIHYLAQNKVKVSLGHSNATFKQAEDSFNSGIHLVTHTFNALPPLHQRHPGAVTAALLNRNVYCCVIGDGLHVDPNMIKLLVKMKGKDRVILVTDIAQVGTASGGLVGSSIKLSQAVLNMVKWGICSFPDAVQMATINPAMAMGLEAKIGHIDEGRQADLVVWDKQSLAVKHVIVNGLKIF